jgi:hypothetical protein
MVCLAWSLLGFGEVEASESKFAFFDKKDVQFIEVACKDVCALGRSSL